MAMLSVSFDNWCTHCLVCLCVWVYELLVYFPLFLTIYLPMMQTHRRPSLLFFICMSKNEAVCTCGRLLRQKIQRPESYIVLRKICPTGIENAIYFKTEVNTFNWLWVRWTSDPFARVIRIHQSPVPQNQSIQLWGNGSSCLYGYCGEAKQCEWCGDGDMGKTAQTDGEHKTISSHCTRFRLCFIAQPSLRVLLCCCYA